MFHADGRTDTTKLTVAFRNFANAPKVTNIELTSTLNTAYELEEKTNNVH
jgi:hypothetical protein